MRWFEKLANWCAWRGRVRIIYDHLDPNLPYLIRFYPLFKDRPWWIPFNLFLHQVLKNDEGGLHDHPWWYLTLVLSGGYWEHTPTGRRWHGPGSILLRKSTSFHKLELNNGQPCWTLFLCGPSRRVWGFINEHNEWEPWTSYVGRFRLRYMANLYRKLNAG